METWHQKNHPKYKQKIFSIVLFNIVAGVTFVTGLIYPSVGFAQHAEDNAEPAPAIALAQNLTGDEGENFRTLVDSLSQGIQLFSADPTLERAKRAVLPQILLELFASRESGLNPQAFARSPSLRLAYLQGNSHLHAFSLLELNRLLNAAAFSRFITQVSGNPEAGESAFATTLDIVPNVGDQARVTATETFRAAENDFIGTAPLLWDANTDQMLRAGDADARLRVGTAWSNVLIESLASKQAATGFEFLATQTGPHAPTSLLQSFLKKLILENEKALLRTYWLYRIKYEGRVPEATTRGIDGAIRGGLIRRNLDAHEYAELRSAVQDARRLAAPRNSEIVESADLRNAVARNLSDLTARLNLAKQNIRQAIQAQRQIVSDERSRNRLQAAYRADQAISTVRLALDIWPNRLSSFDPSQSFGNRGHAAPGYQTDLVVHAPVWAALLKASARSMNRNFCDANNSGLVPIPTNVIVDGRPVNVRQALLATFQKVSNGHGSVLLDQFMNYTQTVRPEIAAARALGDGCAPGSHPGYNRVEWFLNFLRGAYAEQFRASPEQLSGMQMVSEVIQRETAKEPLLMTDMFHCLTETSESIWTRDCTNFEITTPRLQEALREQSDRLARQFERLKTLHYETFVTRETPALQTAGRLLDWNPYVAWRLVAGDWRYTHALSLIYDGLRSGVIRPLNEPSLGQSLGMAAISIVAIVGSQGVGAFIGGQYGVWVAQAGTLFGALLGAKQFVNDATFAWQARERYEALWASLFNGEHITSVVQILNVKRAMDQYWDALTAAGMSGVFLGVDALATLRGLRTLAEVNIARNQYRNLVRQGLEGLERDPRLAVGNIFRSRFRVLHFWERQVQVQRAEVARFLEVNAERDLVEWRQSLLQVGANSSVEEWMAYGMRAFPDELFGASLRAGWADGLRFSFSDFELRVARGMRTRSLQNIFGGSPRGFFSRNSRAIKTAFARARGRTLTVAEQEITADRLNEILGAVVQVSENSIHADATFMNYLNRLTGGRVRNSVGILAEHMRPNTLLHRLFSLTFSELDEPAVILARRQRLVSSFNAAGSAAADGAQAITRPTFDPEFLKTLAEARLDDGGLAGALIRRLKTATGATDESKLIRFARSLRALITTVIVGTCAGFDSDFALSLHSDAAEFVRDPGGFRARRERENSQARQISDDTFQTFLANLARANAQAQASGEAAHVVDPRIARLNRLEEISFAYHVNENIINAKLSLMNRCQNAAGQADSSRMAGGPVPVPEWLPSMIEADPAAASRLQNRYVVSSEEVLIETICANEDLRRIVTHVLQQDMDNALREKDSARRAAIQMHFRDIQALDLELGHN